MRSDEARAHGDVKVSRSIVSEDIYAGELGIGESSIVGNVYASRVEVGDRCHVAGRLLYTNEIGVGRSWEERTVFFPA